MAKIVHVADTHIGTCQYGLEERREDFSKALHQVIDIAIEERVAAVIHAGDLFDSRNPSTEDLRDVLQALFKLKEAGIEFMGIVGNHEHKRGVQWIDLFESLGLATHLGSEPDHVDGIPIYGLDYAGRWEIELPKLSGGALVAHQLVDRVDRVKGELKFERLIDCGAEIVLLGDYHEYESWREEDVLVTYSGTTERWRIDERAKRGCNIIDLEAKRLDRRELKTRRFIYIDEDEDPLKGIDARNVKDAVVCIYLARSDRTVKEIEEYGLSKGALAVQVRDRREARGIGEIDLEVSVEFGDLDEIVSERLDQMELSQISREIDSVIRDERIADSNVDSQVSKVLEEVQPQGELNE